MQDHMREAIQDFPKQFKYEPKIENAVGHLAKFERFAFFGMGGSGLVADIIKKLDPELDIVVHKDYGLPEGVDLNGRFLIFTSYSGDTEETLDAFEKALKEGYHLAVIATGGKLLARARKIGILYIELPRTGIQPRMSLGFQIRAALSLMQRDKLYKEIGKLSSLGAKSLQKEGQEIAENILGKVPVIYSSRRNGAIAYNWKIRFNETGKVAAFWSVIPEANHNEIHGFGSGGNLACIFIKDPADHPRIKKRMAVLSKMYKELKVPVYAVSLEGKNEAEKIFRSTLLADWSAYHTARLLGREANEVPLIKKFKKLING